MHKNKMQLVLGKSGWFLRLKSVNGETLNVSEPYFSHWNAKRAARKLGYPEVEEVKEPGGDPR